MLSQGTLYRSPWFSLFITARRPPCLLSIIAWSPANLNALIHLPRTFIFPFTAFTSSLTGSSKQILTGSGGRGHPCRRPLPTFPDFEQGPIVYSYYTYSIIYASHFSKSYLLTFHIEFEPKSIFPNPRAPPWRVALTQKADVFAWNRPKQRL